MESVLRMNVSGFSNHSQERDQLTGARKSSRIESRILIPLNIKIYFKRGLGLLGIGDLGLVVRSSNSSLLSSDNLD